MSMVKSRGRASLLCVIIVVLTLSFGAVAVYATDTNSSAYKDYVAAGSFTANSVTDEVINSFTGQDGTSTASTKKQANEIEKLAKKYSDAAGNKTITANGKSYTVTEQGYLQIQARVASTAKNEVVKNKVDSIGTDFNVQADTDAAMVALSGIREVVSVIVGILCVVVTLAMTLFTALDICYITMPVFRNKCEDMKQSGGGAMVKTNNSTGETQLRWITDEAVYAVQTCAIETGKNALGLYFKKRVWSYVLVAIVLFILFTGNIQLIVNIAINFVSGLMDALSNLGV